MGYIKVALSPFFGGESWVDECTGIKFEKNPRGLNVYEIPDTYNLTSIKRSIHLNNLMLVEGDPSIMNEVKSVSVPEPAPVEKIVEPPVEEIVEQPKRKSNRKK